jgi:hypothetical protein
VLLGACAAIGTVVVSSATPQPAVRWYKGNTHTHTLNSDGDSAPDDVVRWYREHGYQFLVLSDHNVLTRVESLNALFGLDDRFVLIPGEEVTDRFGSAPVHMNALHIGRLVPPQGGSSLVDVLQRNVDAIRREQGVPHINHPNFGWAFSADELRQVERYRLLEIYNGHPSVNNLGGGGVPGLGEVWDRMLTAGKLVYGIAVDDAHVFKQPGNPNVAGPGRGWVSVRAERLEAGSIMAALERGDFYASTGVELVEVVTTAASVSIVVRETSFSKYRIQFIGGGGRLLAETPAGKATYAFRGDEGYVRARVLESNGRIAWVQPVMVPAGSGPRAK